MLRIVNSFDSRFPVLTLPQLSAECVARMGMASPVTDEPPHELPGEFRPDCKDLKINNDFSLKKGHL